MNTNKFKGKIDFTVHKLIVLGIGFFFLILFICLNTFKVIIPLFIPLTFIFTIVSLLLNLMIIERLSFVEIHKDSQQVIFKKAYFFGLYQTTKIFIYTGNEMDDILRYYKDENYFTIDSINDFLSIKVIFYNSNY
jgi:hypothetical protein